MVSAGIARPAGRRSTGRLECARAPLRAPYGPRSCRRSVSWSCSIRLRILVAEKGPCQTRGDAARTPFMSSLVQSPCRSIAPCRLRRRIGGLDGRRRPPLTRQRDAMRPYLPLQPRRITCTVSSGGQRANSRSREARRIQSQFVWHDLGLPGVSLTSSLPHSSSHFQWLSSLRLTCSHLATIAHVCTPFPKKTRSSNRVGTLR